MRAPDGDSVEHPGGVEIARVLERPGHLGDTVDAGRALADSAVRNGGRETFAAGREAYRVDDLSIPGAAAEVAGKRLADLALAGVGAPLEQIGCGDDEARRAEAALDRTRCEEGVLDRVEPFSFGECLDRAHVVSVDLRVVRNGDDLGTYAPAISTFPNSTTGIGTPSVRTGLLEDLYLTLVSSPNEKGRVTIGVQTEPLTLWLWIGGGLMAVGTLIALAPRVRRRVTIERVVSPPRPPAPDDGDGTAVEGDRTDPDVIGAGAPA
jgi:hypothetical protein